MSSLVSNKIGAKSYLLSLCGGGFRQPSPTLDVLINMKQAEDDMRTLARAEEIRKDAKRFKAAVAMAKEKVKELEALQQLSANS